MQEAADVNTFHAFIVIVLFGGGLLLGGWAVKRARRSGGDDAPTPGKGTGSPRRNEH